MFTTSDWNGICQCFSKYRLRSELLSTEFGWQCDIYIPGLRQCWNTWLGWRSRWPDERRARFGQRRLASPCIHFEGKKRKERRRRRNARVNNRLISPKWLFRVKPYLQVYTASATYGNGNFGHRLFSVQSFHYRSWAALEPITGAAATAVRISPAMMMLLGCRQRGLHGQLGTENVTSNGFYAVGRVDQAAEICLDHCGLPTEPQSKEKKEIFNLINDPCRDVRVLHHRHPFLPAALRAGRGPGG